LGPDGLIAGTAPRPLAESEEAPPFPLEELNAFLVKYREGVDDAQGARFPIGFIKECFFVILLLLVCLPGSYRKKGRLYGGPSAAVIEDRARARSVA
jgi:hypothetical protein